MSIKLLYFHGLNSDHTSQKYNDIKEKFEGKFQSICIVWKNDTNITQLLKTVAKEYEKEEFLVVVGDSTGGNFAYQLREFRKFYFQKTFLIMLNPLLDLHYTTPHLSFPENLKPYIKTINQPTDAFILLSKNDEIIDHSFLINTELQNTTLFWVNDSHRLLGFKNYLSKIEEVVMEAI